MEQEFIHTDAYLSVNSQGDKYIIVYTLLKLGLISGKVIIYTNEVNEGYKLKLYLEQFHLKAALLNYEHPKSTRHLVVSNFVNKAMDILIVVDPDEKESPNKGSKRHKIFKAPVSVLFNFDFPTSYGNYKKRLNDVKHKINSNISILSLILDEDKILLEKVNSRLAKKEENQLSELNLKMQEFERFRYRCTDVLRGVTEKMINKARLDDVKKAILASKEVRSQFDNNSQDKKILQQAKKKIKPQRHLSCVPDYLLPEKLRRDPTPAKYNRNDFEQKVAKRYKRPAQEHDPDEQIEEAPEHIHYKDLPITSNRKKWKIRHHFSLSGGRKKKQRT